MAKPSIKLYVDIVSPFAYIGFYALRNFPVFKNCDVTYVPIFLGGLMHACGNVAPIAVKNKDKWINLERKRWASFFNIPISANAPPNFPVNTLPIQRVLASLSISHPELTPKALSLFWDNFWVEFKEPQKPENLLKIVKELVGSDEEAQKIIESCGTPEVKKQLSSNTDQAFKDGAFGLPWFVATNSTGKTESFWGIDHMGQMIDHLGLERPDTRGWKALL